MSFLDKIFGDENKKYLNKIQPLVDEINGFEPEFKDMSDSELKQRAKNLKQELQKGKQLDDILAQAFALIRESAKRTLSQRPYDVQLIGGIALHQGKIAEMKTGEGKTLAATLPAFLNALSGKGVHLITVNDYLAKRDAVWMGQIYYFLGLSVGCITHDSAYLYDPEYQPEKEETRDEERDLIGSFKVVKSYLRPVARKEAYAADITYGTNNEFGFDYLRDNMVYEKEQKSQRELNFAIVDEVDSILIDEARTPLIISAPGSESSQMYQEYAKIIPHLEKEKDYEVDEKLKAATLTEPGIEKIEKILGMEDIYQEKGIKYLHHLEQALRAQALFQKEKDYVVKNNEIIIVDEFTGRLLPGRRYAGGLHQAIEAKEGVNVRPESITLASISFQNYFRLYKKIAGMTGTAQTSAEEFGKVYGLEAISIPTHKPMARKDLPDLIFKTEQGKLKAVVQKAKDYHKKGRPILVGTRSIEKNEFLGRLLDREGVPHQILNAKHHEQEGEIFAQAGKLGAVTVATNMAGRGVDIILGGNPVNKKDAEKIKELGGLFVIGTERHEARRIDNQLRGRSGRQGDPGISQFFVSLEDDLMRIFGGDKIKSLMETLKIPDDQPIEARIISKALESAQSKVEGANFDARKHLLEYDDVMNKHREVFYKKRNEIIDFPPAELKKKILEIIKKENYSEKDLEEKEKEIGQDKMPQLERFVCLKTLDSLWMDHLENMEALRDSVRLRAYGQIDPLVAYKNEGHKMFRTLLAMVESDIAHTLFKIRLASEPIDATISTSARTNPLQIKKLKRKPGRNDPCPCGSGKKYKKCCWPKYG